MMGAAMKVYTGWDHTTGKKLSVCIEDDQGGRVEIPICFALTVSEWIKACTLSKVNERPQFEKI